MQNPEQKAVQKGSLTEEEIDARIIVKIIGHTMKSARDNLGLSQEAISRRAEISRETYRKTERGESKAEIATLYQIAEALEISIWDLLPESPYKPTPGTKAAPGEDIAYLPQEGSDLLLPSRPGDQSQSNEEIRAYAMAG